MSRNTDPANPLIVNLASNDITEATVPTTVTIPAGRASVTFNIGTMDDTIVDGTQSVTITALATGLADGSDTLDVIDDDLAALSVTIIAALVSEGAGAAATVMTVSQYRSDQFSNGQSRQ